MKSIQYCSSVINQYVASGHFSFFPCNITLFDIIYLGFAGLDNCPIDDEIPILLIAIGAISLALVVVLVLQVLVLLEKIECTQNEWWLSLLYYLLLFAIMAWANFGE